MVKTENDPVQPALQCDPSRAIIEKLVDNAIKSLIANFQDNSNRSG